MPETKVSTSLRPGASARGGLISILLLVSCLCGCTATTSPQNFHQPTASEVSQIQAKNVAAIQNDPNLTPAQKAQGLRALTNPPPP